MTTIKVDARAVFVLSRFISQVPIGRRISGILVEHDPDSHGVILTATDGHTLGTWRDQSGVIDGPSVVLATNAKMIAACKPRKVGEIGRTLSADVEGVIVSKVFARAEKSVFEQKRLTDGAASFVHDVAFPDWRRVVPDLSEEGKIPHGFNARYLGRFDIDPNSEAGCGIQMRTAGGEGPVVVFVSGCDEFLGVIMPMRERKDDPKSDHWFFAKADEAADAKPKKKSA